MTQENPSRAYCTYFDSRYLAQGIVMLRSLRRYDPGATIHVLALDDVCGRVLQEIFGPGIHVTGLETLHSRKPALGALRSERTPWAFYATHKPAFVRYTLDSDPAPESVTFIDADAWFLADPAPMYTEIGAASIGLSPHRFAPASQHLAIYGAYNAGCVYWRADETARRCVADWEMDCLQWCEEQVCADGRFMNQGYLNRWPERYPGVHIIEHPGVNLAPWNIGRHRLARGAAALMHAGGVMVDERPLIFYHFSGLLRDAEGAWFTFYPFADCPLDFALEAIYEPYLAAVENERQLILKTHGIYGTGSVRSWTPGPDAVRLYPRASARQQVATGTRGTEVKGLGWYSSETMSNDPLEQKEETADASFADILNEFESSNRVVRRGAAAPAAKGRGKGKPAGPPAQRGTVVGVSGDFVLIDYGGKAEGVIPAADLRDAEGNLSVKPGDSFDVAITGYDTEGMMTLSRIVGPRPRDWEGLTRAFEGKQIVAGRVTGSVRGGLTVDVGTRAFMPASRSGVREAAEMEKLVGQEIRCRIIKLDVDEEDVVVDRRSVIEEEASQVRQDTLATLQEGAVVRGTVRSLATYGAFIDIGGVDGLLHVSDISWSRVADPSTELAVGDVLELKVLKLDKQTSKISLGLKQMSPDPWKEAVASLNPGDRVTGEITRLADFGAFVEVLPGVEGLIHVSEMSWTKRIQRPSDVLKKGERVEAVVLKVDSAAGRLSLGLRQVLGNPWDTIKDRFPNGKVIEGKVTRLAKFGAFVEVEEGIEGMVHISEFTNEKRIAHPSEVVKVGQVVRAVVLSADAETKRLKLGLKQLEATSADRFAQEVTIGDRVSGRVLEVRGNKVTVQLGEGVEGVCVVEQSAPASNEVSGGSLAAQLAAAWKGGVKSAGTAPTSEPYREGQLRSFTIKAIDAAGKRIELTPA